MKSVPFKVVEWEYLGLIPGFSREVVEKCAFVSFYAASNGNLLQISVQPNGPIFLEFLTLEDGTEGVVSKRRYEITATRCVKTQKTQCSRFRLFLSLRHKSNAS